MRLLFYILVILMFVPLTAAAQTSIMTTHNTSSTNTSTHTNTSTNTANITNSGSGNIYTTISTNPFPTTAQQAALANRNRHADGIYRGDTRRAPEPISDLDTPRKGFDDPRDPWDGRYSNDNPRNYSDGTDQLAAHEAARQAFVNRASPVVPSRNYSRGGVHYGPVRTR